MKPIVSCKRASFLMTATLCLHGYSEFYSFHGKEEEEGFTYFLFTQDIQCLGKKCKVYCVFFYFAPTWVTQVFFCTHILHPHPNSSVLTCSGSFGEKKRKIFFPCCCVVHLPWLYFVKWWCLHRWQDWWEYGVKSMVSIWLPKGWPGAQNRMEKNVSTRTFYTPVQLASHLGWQISSAQKEEREREREREPSASFLCSCRREKQWAADQRRLKGKAKFARSNQSPFHPLSLSLSLSLAAALSDFLTTAFSQWVTQFSPQSPFHSPTSHLYSCFTFLLFLLTKRKEKKKKKHKVKVETENSSKLFFSSKKIKF